MEQSDWSRAARHAELHEMQESDNAFTLAFPLVVIDFEATGLTPTSYPIEVGAAKIAKPGGKIETWSTLIQPAPDWDIDREWDPDAQRLHGIRQWDLRSGMPAAMALAMLNQFAGGGIVWCDGGHYDAQWLSLFIAAAGIEPAFVLQHIQLLLRADSEFERRYRQVLSATAAPHRAGADAARICIAVAEAFRFRTYRTVPLTSNLKLMG